MKPFKNITPAKMETTVGDVCRWAQALDELHARIAPRFARPEPRRRVLAYLRGVLSSTERKNSWQLAQHGRRASPYGMQRLLASAVWDADLVRDDLRGYVLEQLGEQDAILVIDETSFRQQRQEISWRQEAVLWNHRTARELSSGCVSRRRDRERSYPHRP